MDSKEGRGKLVFENGEEWSGMWRKNLPEGKGIFVRR